jgi:iron complex outermembrane receptor protein
MAEPEANPLDEGVADIVVTASRREERLQDVPMSITAIAGATLEQTGIAQTTQLPQVTPGLLFSRNTSAVQVTIRGVGSRATTPGDEANVAVYVDGIYQPFVLGANFDLLAIDRVEVLRGPQGTLFGRNSTGGLINIITSDPSKDFGGTFVARYGRFDELWLKGRITGPLSDSVAFSLDGMFNDDNGFVRNLTGGDRLGDRRAYVGRGKLLIEPSDKFRAVLAMQYSDQDDIAGLAAQPLDGNTAGRPLGAPIPPKPWQAALSFRPELRLRQFSASLQTTTDLGFASLNTSLAFQRSKIRTRTDSDASTVNLSQAKVRTRDRNYQAEIRLSSNGDGGLQWMIGTFGFIEKAGYEPLQVLTNGNVTSTQVSNNLTRSIAAFADATVEIVPDLELRAGARYTYEKRHFTATNTTPARVASVDATASFSQFTPRAGISYHFAPKSQVYATFSRGFKSGVFNTGSVNPNAVRPETLSAYEIGVKSDPLSWLRTNLSAFHYDYSNIQVSIRDLTGATTLQNATTAKIDGGELEVTADVLPELSVRFAGSYLDAKYGRFPGALITIPLPGGGNTQTAADVSGARVIRAPKFTMTVGADFSQDFSFGKVAASANLYHSSRFYWDVYNRLSQAPFVQLNGQVSLTLPGDRLTFSVYGENITNEAVQSMVVTSTLGDYAIYQKPMTYGIQARWNF